MRIDTDRLLVVALALLGTCVVSVAVADPPAAPAATPAPASTTSVAPAATPAPSAAAAAAVKPPVTVNATAEADAAQAAEDKRLMAAGYKPEMRNGTKYWCRTEQELGSNLRGHKVCGTASEIKAYAHDSQESVEQAQRRQINPTGR